MNNKYNEVIDSMKRQVFFSFEYRKDVWRASQIRNMGIVEDDSTFSDNDWEKVKVENDKTIKEWIDDQIRMRSCIVVLIGETTYTRKWVLYEIQKAYQLNKGIIGVYVHRLKNRDGTQCSKGLNPFDEFVLPNGKSLSNYVKVYDPGCSDSKQAYDSIKEELPKLIEYAISHKPPRNE